MSSTVCWSGNSIALLVVFRICSELWRSSIISAFASSVSRTKSTPTGAKRQLHPTFNERVGDLLVGLACCNEAEDFELAYTSADAPGDWVTLIPHTPGTRLEGVDAFANHLVVSLRKDGLTGLRVLPLTGGADYDIAFPEPIYTVEPGDNEINIDLNNTPPPGWKPPRGR